MDAVRHHIIIDVTWQVIDGTIHIRDRSVGHRIDATLTNGERVIGIPDAFDGLAQLVYRKPDGTKSDVEMEKDGEGLSAMLPMAALDTPGRVDCEIRLYGKDAVGPWLITPIFTLTVEASIFDTDTMDAITDQGSLDPDEVEDLTEALEQLGAEMTPPQVQTIYDGGDIE